MPDSPDPKSFGIIYKATNSVTGKVYIGLTTKTLEQRIHEHVHRSKHPPKNRFYFQNALVKYGLDSFSWDILETCFSIEQLKEREIYYISLYKSYDKEFGYNLTIGGDGCSGNDETRRKIGLKSKGRRHTAATKKIISEAQVGRKQSEETKEKNRQSQYKRYEDPEVRKRNKEILDKARKLRKFSEETRRKMSEASKGRVVSEETKEKQRAAVYRHISIYGSRKQTEETKEKLRISNTGKIVTAETREKISRSGRERPTVGSAKERKAVLQLDLEGNIISRYVSIKEAARQTKINPSGISDVCIGKGKVAGDYLWCFDLPEYEGLKKIPVAPVKKGRARAVLKLDAQGNVLERYTSIKEAAEACGLQRPGINNVCLGKQPLCGGFSWAYADVPLKYRNIKND